VGSREVERLGPVASRCQRREVTDREPAAQRLELRELPPPADGSIGVVCSRSFGRQRCDGIARGVVQTRPLFLDPPLKRRSAWQIEPGEKWPTDECGGHRAVAAAERGAEVDHIGRDGGRLEAQRKVRSDDVAPDLVAQRVQRLTKRVASTLIVDVRPEQPRQSLARNVAVSLGGEHRQEGEPLRAEPGWDSLVDGFERESAKRHEVEHLVLP
jgi:hypothetical protein